MKTVHRKRQPVGNGVAHSPSQIVVEALGWLPDGVPSKAHCTCVCCGVHISPGDLWAPISFKRGFVDTSSFAAPGSIDMCGWCAVVTGVEGLQRSARGIFSAAGVTPFGVWLAMKAALLDPPEPPFVALYATKNNQHMAWRAPISFNRDLFYVRLGEDSLLIRRPILLEALEASSRLRVALDEYFQKKKTSSGSKSSPAGDALKLRAKSARRVVPHVFLRLSSDIKDADHGVINPALYKLDGIRDGKMGDDIRLLETLTLGELWALTFVTYLGSSEETDQSLGDK